MSQAPMNPHRSTTPAYREPYFWLVVLFPATAVIAGVITLFLALRTEDGLVADDYYRRGLEINRDLGRDRAAALHGLSAEVQANRQENTLSVILRGNDSFTTPERIQVLLSHPTQAGLDKSLTLSQTAVHRYTAPLPKLVAGRWYLQIEADDWRLLQTWSADK